MHVSARRARVWTYAWSGASEEDQAAEVGSALVAEGASGIDQSSNTVRLDGATDQGRSPSGGSAGGLLGFEEFFLGVGGLGAVVGVTEDRAEDGERDGVIEDSAQSDSARLHGRQVWNKEIVSVMVQ